MKRLLCVFSFLFLLRCSFAGDFHQASGVKVGEVSDSSAIIWTRTTEESLRNTEGIERKGGPAGPLPDGVSVDDLKGACPGMAGEVRVWYQTMEKLAGLPYLETHGEFSDDVYRVTEWARTGPENDFVHQFHLQNLEPNSYYVFAVEVREAGNGSGTTHQPLMGYFKTAPSPDDPSPVRFTVVTGQAYKDADCPEGFRVYRSMAELKPDFIVPTGDSVYYDNEDPRATTVELARFHWHRMYSLPSLFRFHLHVPGYWIKDDHDTLSNDCWPGRNPEFMRPMTFEEGQRLFREQVPMGDKTYRTYRWGKLLQIWLTEGRDYRSPNTIPDGATKTIWGTQQKKWLKQSILRSHAEWKILVSATPLVGPDRSDKKDNHAGAAFATEGDEIRRWIRYHAGDDLFVVCGDRHWQYHSVDPETGVQEFGCGPTTDRHAGGFPEEAKDACRFHRVKGGFLSVTVTPDHTGSEIAFRHHDVFGNVVYEYKKRKPRCAP